MNAPLTQKDFLGVYSNMLEMGLRAGNVVQKGIERSVREHLSYLQKVAEGAPGVDAKASPQQVMEAQTTSLQQATELLTATTKRMMEIQQQVASELKALTEEAASKLSLFKKS
jgi:hypothetical protein